MNISSFLLILATLIIHSGLAVVAQDLYMKDALRLVNEYRKSSGLRPLCLNANLIIAAKLHSKYMAGKGMNRGKGLNRLSERLHNANYTLFSKAGELIAHGRIGRTNKQKYARPSAPIDMWKNSTESKTKLLDPIMTQMGIAWQQGKAQSSIPVYWSLTLGNSNLRCLRTA